MSDENVVMLFEATQGVVGRIELEREFEKFFWPYYPRRVAKLAARKAYIKARQQEGATLHELMDGIDRYRLSKPTYADWCHPATWLNQGRWLDEEDSPEDQRERIVEKRRVAELRDKLARLAKPRREP